MPSSNVLPTTQAFREYCKDTSKILREYHEFTQKAATALQEGRKSVPTSDDDDAIVIDSASSSLECIISMDLILNGLQFSEDKPSEEAIESHAFMLTDLASILGLIGTLVVGQANPDMLKGIIEKFKEGPASY